MAQPVAFLVIVIMPASDSVASDMSGLIGRLTSFQKPPPGAATGLSGPLLSPAVAKVVGYALANS